MSTFSLDFHAIGPANSSEARCKVGLHCKGYTWVPDLWSLCKTQEIPISGKGQNRNFDYKIVISVKNP